MALIFNNTNGQHVSGDVSAIAGATDFTATFWTRSGAALNDRYWQLGDGDTSNKKAFYTTTGGASLYVQVDRATALSESRVLDSVTGINGSTWTFIAATYDETNGIRIYSAPLGGFPTEASAYGAQEVGSGATITESGNYYIGNRSDGLRTFLGRISDIRFFNTSLTTGQMASVMYSKPCGVQAKIQLPLLGYSTEPDWSGNAANGTVSNSPTYVEGPPFAQFFSSSSPIFFSSAAANNASFASTLEDMSADFSATITRLGALSASLEPFTAAFESKIAISVDLAGSLEALEAAFSAEITRLATLSSALEDFSAAFVATSPNKVDFVATLEDVSASFAANVTRLATLSATLEDISLEFVSAIAIVGDLSAALEDISPAFSATLTRLAALAISLEDIGAAGSAIVGTSATFAATLEDSVLSGAAISGFVGQLDLTLEDIVMAGSAIIGASAIFATALEDAAMDAAAFAQTGHYAWENLDVFFDIGDFATTAERLSDGLQIVGIFDAMYVDAMLGEYAMDTDAPRFTCKEYDARSVHRGDVFRIQGLLYDVLSGPHGDGTGIAILELASRMN